MPDTIEKFEIFYIRHADADKGDIAARDRDMIVAGIRHVFYRQIRTVQQDVEIADIGIFRKIQIHALFAVTGVCHCQQISQSFEIEIPRFQIGKE